VSVLTATDRYIRIYAGSLVNGVSGARCRSTKSKTEAERWFRDAWDSGGVRRVT
jgi:hypothetical protein